MADAADFAPWWNGLGLILLCQVLIFAALGWLLPSRVLRAGWIAAPVANAVLLATSFLAYRGPLPVSASPWAWAFEAALVSYTVLTLRVRWGLVVTVATALLPMLSAAVFLGEVPRAVLVETPIHVANVIYIVIFGAIRARLMQLREVEALALEAESRSLRAQVSVRDRQQLARLIHDEVLSVLAAAMSFRGTPPPELRQAARLAVELFESPTVDRFEDEVRCGEAAERIVALLRRVDPSIRIADVVEQGTVPCRVVETVGAAAAEALRNSVRHAARAPRHANLSVSSEQVRVVIVDRGPGFDAAHVRGGRLGLTGSIVERMRELPGGDATVRSAPGAGTTVEVTWRT